MMRLRAPPPILAGCASVLGGLAVWTLIVRSGLISTRFTPTPLEILREFVSLVHQGYVGIPFHDHIAASLIRTLIGFSLATLAGIPFGLLIGRVRMLEAAFVPWFAFLRPIPAIAFVPLVILWFGIGEFSKISVIFFSSFLYITVATIAGVKSVPVQVLRAGYSLGALHRKAFLYVVLPAALPQIMVGVRLGSAISWTLVVAAELVAAQRGLGYMIMDASTFFRVKDVYVGLIVIGIIGFLLESIIALVERRLVHWSGK
jgi:ABC-type nitrate/sulfonate/bicarbonate transport system permease component